MYGNYKIPDFKKGTTVRESGSIWKGEPQATWWAYAKCKGALATATDLPLGTIVKEDPTDGTFVAAATTDIVAAASAYPGVQLAIVADNTAKVTNAGDTTVLLGISGLIDKEQLIIRGVKISTLTAAQQRFLTAQLRLWGFSVVEVQQS